MVPKTKRDSIKVRTGNLECDMERKLGSYIVTNCSLVGTPNETSLVLNFTRRSESYWMSVFIPSICLIVAAELTLFIDEKHFKAAITVSLTANLVMYTLYRAVQVKLPDDSSLKLIDMWLLHGLLMPMVVFIILTTNHLIESNKSDDKQVTKDLKVGKSKVKIAFAEAENHQKTVGCFMLLCKALVPITSALFTITFFIVILFNMRV